MLFSCQHHRRLNQRIQKNLWLKCQNMFMVKSRYFTTFEDTAFNAANIAQRTIQPYVCCNFIDGKPTFAAPAVCRTLNTAVRAIAVHLHRNRPDQSHDRRPVQILSRLLFFQSRKSRSPDNDVVRSSPLKFCIYYTLTSKFQQG